MLYSLEKLEKESAELLEIWNECEFTPNKIYIIWEKNEKKIHCVESLSKENDKEHCAIRQTGKIGIKGETM